MLRTSDLVSWTCSSRPLICCLSFCCAQPWILPRQSITARTKARKFLIRLRRVSLAATQEPIFIDPPCQENPHPTVLPTPLRLATHTAFTRLTRFVEVAGDDGKKYI